MDEFIPPQPALEEIEDLKLRSFSFLQVIDQGLCYTCMMMLQVPTKSSWLVKLSLEMFRNLEFRLQINF